MNEQGTVFTETAPSWHVRKRISVVLVIFSLLSFISAIITIWAAWMLPNTERADNRFTEQDQGVLCSFLFLVMGVALFTTHIIVSGF